MTCVLVSATRGFLHRLRFNSSDDFRLGNPTRPWVSPRSLPAFIAAGEVRECRRGAVTPAVQAANDAGRPRSKFTRARRMEPRHQHKLMVHSFTVAVHVRNLYWIRFVGHVGVCGVCLPAVCMKTHAAARESPTSLGHEACVSFSTQTDFVLRFECKLSPNFSGLCLAF